MAGFDGLYLSAGSQYVGIWRVCVIYVTYFCMEWRISVTVAGGGGFSAEVGGPFRVCCRFGGL